MRRARKIVLWMLAIPVVLVALLFFGLNIGPGRILAEQVIGRVLAGQVRVAGLHGRFPDSLRLDHLEVLDAKGAWLIADGVALDWSPTRLVQRMAAIGRLSIDRVQLPRLAEGSPAPATPAPASATFQLPVQVSIDAFQIDRLELGAPVAGAAAVLRVSGRADIPSLTAGQADIALTRLDSPGAYTLHAAIDPAHLTATLDATEPAGGFLAQLASVPGLGPLTIAAKLDGPRSAVGTAVSVSAGPLRARAQGTLDLVGNAADLDVTADAPAMTPRPDVSWRSVAVRAHVRGPFTAPDATGQVRIEGIEAAGAGLGSLVADIQGNAGRVGLHAVATALRLPAPAAGLLAAAPVLLDADIRLDDPARPVTFAVSHPLLTAKGTARTGGDLDVTADVALTDLTPFAALGGTELHGRTALAIKAGIKGATTTVQADGTLTITGGLAPVPALVGSDAPVGVTVALTGADIAISRMDFAGHALTLGAEGGLAGGVVDLGYRVGLKDLAVLAPTLQGALQLQGRAKGRTDDLSLDVAATGEVGAPGVPRGPIKLDAKLTGLPGAPAGRIAAEGVLAGSPLTLLVQAKRGADGAMQATIERAAWKSLQAEGAVSLAPGAALPQGRVSFRMTRLDDLRPLIGQAVSGSVVATAELGTAARLTLTAENAGIPGSRVGHLTLNAEVTDPTGHPSVVAHVAAEGIDAGGTTGSARVDINGPQTALAVRTTAGLRVSGTDAQITGAAVVNATAKTVQLSALQVAAKGETVRLLAPAQIRLADGVAVDRVRLGVRQAVLEVAGRLSPTLDAAVTLRTPADIAAAFMPDAAADGTIAIDAKLTGTPAQPGGTVRVTATGLRARTGPGRSLPAANLVATAQLGGGSAQIDSRLTAGSAAQVTVTGRAPLGAGALALRAVGALDLTLLDPILTASGRRARGRLSLDAAVGGTVANPALSGSAQLAGGEIQDFGQGVRINDITASLRADGQVVRIVSLTGKAGAGTIAASGSIGVGAPGLPLDLQLQMRNARPLASDRLTADIDADITLRGPVAAPQAAGKIVIRGAEIRIPERLPASIAVLNVRRPGQRPAAPAVSTAIGLDLVVEAPRAIFLRGRGIDAEMSGTLRVQGSSVKPQVGGGFEMRRGTLSAAGTTLTFTRGKVGFDGTGVTGKIDPTLDFAADSTAANVVATLSITGYASAPKIKFSSVPDLPQDEVLAYLLFKRSSKELGPFQLAEIAAAVASLTGVGGGGANPLESVRRGLGLDRLSVGGGSTPGSAPSIEAGRYVGNGVYVGAKQGTTGGQTQATVQIDITKGLKAQTDVGTGAGGNSVGLTYQFEY